MRTKIVIAALVVAALGAAFALRHSLAGWTGTPAASADDDPIIAKVGDSEIHRSELDRQIRRITRGQTPPPAQLDSIKQSAFKELVSGHLLLQEATRRGISASAEELQQQIANLEQRAGGSEGLAKALAENQLSREDLERGLARDIAISKLLEAALPSEPVSPEEQHAFYDNNPELFAAPESVRARHILVRSGAEATAEQKSAAKKKAEELLSQLKAGADFAALAAASSEDPGSAAKGGDLGFFPRGSMAPPFESAAFALAPGEISDLVETQFGYHILKLEEKKAAGKRSFAEVEPSIARYIEGQKKRGKVEQLVVELRSKTAVEVLDPALAAAPAAGSTPSQGAAPPGL